MKNDKLVFQPMKCLSQEDIRIYLSGSLDKSTLYRIENHLLDCPLCNEAVEGFARGYNFTKDNEIAELRKAVSEKTGLSSVETKTIYFTLNRIAAAILFLVISVAAFFYWNVQNSQKDVLAEIQSSNNLLETVRSGEGFQGESQLKEGITLFSEEAYQESLFFFENYLEVEPENATAHYFSGMSALKLGHFNKAIENLTYARINDENFYEDATWNLVLANLGLEKNDEAKALLNDLLKIEGGFYFEKAKKLLKEIE